MAEMGTKIADLLIDLLVTAVLFSALFPTVNTQINNMGLDNITLFGTSYDFSWAGYLLILAVILVIVYFAIGKIKSKK